MATLSKLPPELILEICLHIHDHDLDKPDIKQDWDVPQNTLASLCRVSKALCGIAQPILFERVHVRFETRGAVCPKFISLLTLLIGRPDLSERVRMLKLSISVQPIPSGYPLPWYTQPGILDCIELAASNQSWMSGLQSRWFDTIPARNHVLMGLLLAKVPSLENMQCSVPDYWGSHDVLSQDLRTAVSQKKVLTRLEVLDVHPNSDFQTSALNLYREAYFALIQPQLTTFHCRGYQAFGPHAGWSQITHIKNLAVHDCDMKASELDTVATICQSLQAFAYTALPMAASDTWQRQRGSPKEFSAALRKHSQTLKELHLEVNFRKDRHIWNGGISSFEDFNSLESLKISPLDFAETFILPSTLGSHGFSATLPSTLKHLTISRWCWPIRIDIDWLSQAACRGELDNLETLDIEYCLSATKDRFIMANDLRERLESDTGGRIMFFIRVRKVEDRHTGIAYSDRR